MSPEFQIINKIIGCRILAHAVGVGVGAAEQHGSWKFHKAINTCLNKKLISNVFCQKKRAGAVAINNDVGCYDPVSHPIAVLTLVSFGVPQKVGRILFETLRKARHHIKTGFGRSHAIYGNESVPISGVGQGNGLGPTLWALISTILFCMMAKAGHGVHLFSATTLTLVSVVGFAFVNHSDLFCAGKTPISTGEQVAPEFQASLDRWAGGLRATGGSIEPSKSFCYLIDFL